VAREIAQAAFGIQHGGPFLAIGTVANKLHRYFVLSLLSVHKPMPVLQRRIGLRTGKQ
jgi:hypothetical protein